MPQVLFLGIDLGTSATKMGLVALDGKVVAEHSEPNRVESPHPGWMEMQPEEWWAGLCRGIPTLCRKAGVDAKAIGGVAFSVLYPALIPMDAEGCALRPAILYSDQRSVRQLNWLREHIGDEEIFRIVGNVPSVGTCSLTSLLWLKENEPETFARARFFGHANTYLVARLTGEVGMEWSNATLTGLFETSSSFTWSQRLAEAAGIPLEKLPPIYAPYAVIGRVTQEAARATSLAAGTPVCLGAGDTACSSFGVGLLEQGDNCLTCGTTDNLALCVARPRFDRRFVTSAYVMKDRWLLIGTMSNTGAALEWCARLIWGSGQGGSVPYEKALTAAATVESGAGGLLFLPYLHGERSPVWDAGAKGVFCGLTLRTSSAHLARAVLEGCAFALRQNVEIAEGLAGGPITELLVMGGGSRSALWNQIKANVLQRRLRLVTVRESSLLGAAMLAAVGAGAMDNPVSTARAMKAPASQTVIEPDTAQGEVYEELYRVYLKLYPALAPIFAHWPCVHISN